MPGPYGVVVSGFNRKTTQDILSDIRAKQLATISTALDLSTVTPWGQNNGIFADELAAAWEVLEVCYHAYDPDQAEDFLLTSLSKLTGTDRRAASYSGVTLTCGLLTGTQLVSGTHFAAVDGNPESLWTPVENYTAATDGDQDVRFRAENAGVVSANSGSITVINTAVSGWSSVTNAEDADEGYEIDTDATLRQRREEQLTARGSATTEAIESDLLEVAGVVSVTVVENDSDGTVDGVPPHYIHAIVFDGEGIDADNDEIAQAIWDSRAAGIGTTGSTGGVATDTKGVTHAVYFSRPDQIPIYIAATVSKGLSYDDLGGATGLKEYLVTELKAAHSVGQDVQYRLADSLPLYHGGLRVGVTAVSAFFLGTGAGPTGTTDIAISPTELAVFDTSRIGITAT
jgi:uncharacterized phage protein gp47/JayE